MKYGWEIADEVQRFAGNSADTQFVPHAEYVLLEERLRIADASNAEKIQRLENALKFISEQGCSLLDPCIACYATRVLRQTEKNELAESITKSSKSHIQSIVERQCKGEG